MLWAVAEILPREAIKIPALFACEPDLQAERETSSQWASYSRGVDWSVEKIGKYDILSKIGSGGFALVYKGYDPFIKRFVAIKLCILRDEEIRQRFYREAEIAGRLAHRNITTVYDFGLEGEIPYLVEEYLSGQDLAQLLRERQPMTLETKVDILRQLARGLGYAHRQGVIHRDIKPGNIRVLEDGLVKIMDFGTAKLTQVESQLTQTGMTLGTISYLSPERLLGEPVGVNSDLFSYGVLAYKLLAGRRPFRGASMHEISSKILEAEPTPLTRCAPDCPTYLAGIIHRCLEKDPRRRYASAREILEDLDHPDGGLGPKPAVSLEVQLASLLGRAEDLIARGKHRRARWLLAEVLEMDPGHPDASQLLQKLQSESNELPRTSVPTTAERESADEAESEANQRQQRVADAVQSIRKYLDKDELARAAAALSFAVELLGPFGEAQAIRRQIAERLRDALHEVSGQGARLAEGLESTLKGLANGRGLVTTATVERLGTWLQELTDGPVPRFVDRAHLASLAAKGQDPRQAEAVASIEKLLADGQPEMARRALDFALDLLGDFEQAPLLERRIAEALEIA